jgi:hypothetical protein
MVRFCFWTMAPIFLRKVIVTQCYRYGASVGFCDATTEMIFAPSFVVNRD